MKLKERCILGAEGFEARALDFGNINIYFIHEWNLQIIHLEGILSTYLFWCSDIGLLILRRTRKKILESKVKFKISLAKLFLVNQLSQCSLWRNNSNYKHQERWSIFFSSVLNRTKCWERSITFFAYLLCLFHNNFILTTFLLCCHSVF